MTYEEIFAKAKEEFSSADVSKYEGHLALQVNITGEGEGIFYAEINEGKLFIEPYDYKDNDAVLTADGNDILSLFSGTLDTVKAFEEGKITVTGDINKALSIQPIIESNKKTVKKTSAKKTTAKSAASKTAKSTKKSEEPAIIGLAEPTKTPAAKTAAKKTAAKESTKPAKKTTKTTPKKG